MEKSIEINYSSKASQRQYWYATLTYVLLYFVFSAVIGLSAATAATQQLTMSSISATPDAVNVLNVVVSAAVVLTVIVFPYMIVHQIGMAVRRARDAGNTLGFTLLALIVPFGWYILGFIQSKK